MYISVAIFGTMYQKGKNTQNDKNIRNNHSINQIATKILNDRQIYHNMPLFGLPKLTKIDHFGMHL
jgi:hypothetical protein